MTTAKQRRDAAGLEAVTVYVKPENRARLARYVTRQLGGEAPDSDPRGRANRRAVISPDSRRYSSVTAAAKAAGVTRATIYAWIKDSRYSWRYA